jgi:uncharacterized protein (TIGR04222 family)
VSVAVRRILALSLLLAAVHVGLPSGSAWAQGSAFESIKRYDVRVDIQPSGSMLVTEIIDYDFGSVAKHGIFRDIPERLHYDDTYDRIYWIDVLSVKAGGAPADFEVEHQSGGILHIRIGNPDVTVSGEHVYTIVYRVDGALNGFADHDELYWNAIGADWDVQIDQASARVTGPGPVTKVGCFTGPVGSTLGCAKAGIKNGAAVFSQPTMPPYNALSVVVALPKGSVASTAPILEERWSLDRAFERTPSTVGGSVGLLAVIVIGFGLLVWRRGRDRRYRGSQVDQVMGSPGGQEQAVPLFESSEAPVEFAPPEDLRPGQVGTLIDERANTLDVTATIIDLAVRKYMVIEEIEKQGWFGKPDWKLTRTDKADDDLLSYERKLLDALFATGNQVLMSGLKTKFHQQLAEVEDALYADAVQRKWFLARPDAVRERWVALGAAALVVSAGLGFVLVRWTKLGLFAIPFLVGALLILVGARWMPRRTAKGTAITRRVNGFRRVIETAETHMSRWAEQENVFTRYLPFAIVFGCTDKWAKAFEGLALPADTSWYVSSRPFVYASFAAQMDGFTVTTSGTISSTPAGSGGSGFGGGGSSGGGGGGGGGGSW